MSNVYWFIYLFIYLFPYFLFIHLCIYLFIHLLLFIYSLIYFCIHSYIYLFPYLFILLLFIYSLYLFIRILNTDPILSPHHKYQSPCDHPQKKALFHSIGVFNFPKVDRRANRTQNIISSSQTTQSASITNKQIKIYCLLFIIFLFKLII